MNFSPFVVVREKVAPRPLNLNSTGVDVLGVGDRLRSAAFAEVQAEAAFVWAARTFTDAPAWLKEAWLHLASEERKHQKWLLQRLTELNQSIDGAKVNSSLWYALTSAKNAEEFCTLMADAEDRGRRAGERFYEVLCRVDPVTAEIFGQIAREEVSHIELSRKFLNGKELTTDLR